MGKVSVKARDLERDLKELTLAYDTIATRSVGFSQTLGHYLEACLEASSKLLQGVDEMSKVQRDDDDATFALSALTATGSNTYASRKKRALDLLKRKEDYAVCLKHVCQCIDYALLMSGQSLKRLVAVDKQTLPLSSYSPSSTESKVSHRVVLHNSLGIVLGSSLLGKKHTAFAALAKALSDGQKQQLNRDILHAIHYNLGLLHLRDGQGKGHASSKDRRSCLYAALEQFKTSLLTFRKESSLWLRLIQCSLELSSSYILKAQRNLSSGVLKTKFQYQKSS